MRPASIRRFVAAVVTTAGVALALATRGGAAQAQPAPASGAGPGPNAGANASEDLSARDRITFNAGLDALVGGDLAQARRLFNALATQGDTATVRSAAILIVDRISGLERRRDAGLVPALRAPPATTQIPPGGTSPTGANVRAPVVATTTLLGLALWGWTLPGMLGVHSNESSRAYVGLYMTTAAASFVAPYLITRDRPPSESQLNLIFYGGTRGAAWGQMLANLFLGDVTGNESDHPRAFAGSLLLGSVGGVIAGSLLAPRLDLAPGDVRTIAALGDYGFFLGLTMGHILGPAGADDNVARGPSSDRARVLSAGGLLGSAAGLAGGHWLTRHRRNSWGDGEVMRGAAALGVLAGATGVIAFDFQDNSKLLLGFMAAGGALGLVGGDAFVSDTSFSPGEALLVDLALLTGGLGAAGLTYLIADAEGPKPYFLAATGGAAIAGSVVARALAKPDRAGDLARAGTGIPRLTLLPQFGASGPAGVSLVGVF